MNKFLAIFAVLLLVGSGCATYDDRDSAVESESEHMEEVMEEKEENSEDEAMEDEADNGETASADSAMAAPSEEGSNTNEMVVEDGGVNVVVEAVEEAPNMEPAPEEEEIQEIVLGGNVDQTVSMESGNFFFAPSTITAAPGERVKVQFAKNSGFHTFVIDEIGFKASIKEGDSATFTAPSTPGSYAYYCDIGSHRAQGMEGVLIVQ